METHRLPSQRILLCFVEPTIDDLSFSIWKLDIRCSHNIRGNQRCHTKVKKRNIPGYDHGYSMNVHMNVLRMRQTSSFNYRRTISITLWDRKVIPDEYNRLSSWERTLNVLRCHAQRYSRLYIGGGLKVGQMQVRILMYADDIIILSEFIL